MYVYIWVHSDELNANQKFFLERGAKQASK